MRRSLFGAVLITVIMLFGVSRFSFANLITNGDFSNGTAGWITDGDVSVENEAAVLRDFPDGYALLYQEATALDPGFYRLSFDYWVVSLGSAVTFDDGSRSAPDLFDFYYDPNPSPMAPLEISGPSNLDQKWYPFSLTIEDQAGTATLTFSLFDYNFLNDGTVLIDNVSLTPTAAPPTPIPEPGALLSMALGLIGLVIAGKKKLLS